MTDDRPDLPALTELSLRVTGMHCRGCEERLTTLVGRLDGVRGVTAEHRHGEVRILLDPRRATTAVICEHLERAGYAVTSEEAKP